MSTAEPLERISMTHEERQAALAKIHAMLDEDEAGPVPQSLRGGMSRAWPLRDDSGAVINPSQSLRGGMSRAWPSLVVLVALGALLCTPRLGWMGFKVGLILGTFMGAVDMYILCRASRLKRGG